MRSCFRCLESLRGTFVSVNEVFPYLVTLQSRTAKPVAGESSSVNITGTRMSELRVGVDALTVIVVYVRAKTRVYSGQFELRHARKYVHIITHARIALLRSLVPRPPPSSVRNARAQFNAGWKNGGRRPGQISHVIRGTGVISASRGTL